MRRKNLVNKYEGAAARYRSPGQLKDCEEEGERQTHCDLEVKGEVIW